MACFHAQHLVNMSLISTKSVINKNNMGQAYPEVAQSDPQIGQCNLYVTKHHVTYFNTIQSQFSSW